jgi:hypothetical protein
MRVASHINFVFFTVGKDESNKNNHLGSFSYGFDVRRLSFKVGQVRRLESTESLVLVEWGYCGLRLTHSRCVAPDAAPSL